MIPACDNSDLWMFSVPACAVLVGWVFTLWLDAKRIKRLETQIKFMARAHQKERERVASLMALSPHELWLLVKEVDFT